MLISKSMRCHTSSQNCSILDIFFLFKNEVLGICVFLQILSKFATAFVRYLWVVKNDKSNDKSIIKNIILLSVFGTVLSTYFLIDSIPYYGCRFEKTFFLVKSIISAFLEETPRKFSMMLGI